MSVRAGALPGLHLLLMSPDGGISSWFWDSWGFTKEKTDTSFAVFGDNLIHEPIYRYGLLEAGNLYQRPAGRSLCKGFYRVSDAGRVPGDGIRLPPMEICWQKGGKYVTTFCEKND